MHRISPKVREALIAALSVRKNIPRFFWFMPVSQYGLVKSDAVLGRLVGEPS
jgi:hypothetical protein